MNGIFEALRRHEESLKFIQVRHEEAAAFAACGYAKYTGRLGVCLATSGPGGIHLLNGLYDAKCDSQSVLAITGHTFHDLIGTHYQQDVDLDKLFMDVAVYNERIMGPAHVNNVLDLAVKTALSRRSVSHITIPKDIQEWTSADEERSSANIAKHSEHIFAASYPQPPQKALEDAAALINSGSHVAILAGAGCLKAREEVLQLADKLNAPVIKPLLGKAAIPDDSPYTTGGLGLLGTAPSMDVMAECDTLIIAGSGFPYMEFYPKPGQARCVQIDIDPARIGLRYPAEVGLTGDLALIHCNSYADGFWTDITRSFHLGPPDAPTRGRYEAVLEARRAALARIAPGVCAADVDRAAREVLESRGLGAAFKHATGHGVGFSAFDPNARPRVHPLSPDVLEIGKNHGMELSKVRMDYLEWSVSHLAMDEDIERGVVAEIARRTNEARVEAETPVQRITERMSEALTKFAARHGL